MEARLESCSKGLEAHLSLRRVKIARRRDAKAFACVRRAHDAMLTCVGISSLNPQSSLITDSLATFGVEPCDRLVLIRDPKYNGLYTCKNVGCVLQ